MHLRKRQSGFTLIELLLSLSILSIILVIILGALRIGARAWEKGEHMLSAQQRSRAILDQLTRQLTSASVLMSTQEEQPLVQFAGNSQTIEFTAGLPLMTKILLLYEENITAEDYLSERQLRYGKDAHVLIEALADLRFEYLGADSDGPDLNWTSLWQSQNLTDLPRAVRITYRDEKNGHTVRAIARIHQGDKEGSESEDSKVQRLGQSRTAS
jgi:general secretion pathway protein J